MNFNIAGKNVMEISMDNAYGVEHVGGYGLYLHTKYQINPWTEEGREDVYIRNLHMVLRFNHKLLGQAFPESICTYTPAADFVKSGTLSFAFTLSEKQLEVIEKSRLGGDLAFEIEIKCEWGDKHNPSMSASTRQDYRINQKAWLDILKKMKYGSYILFELPFNVAAKSELAETIGYFENAKKQLFYGHYPEVVTECRKVLEALIDGASLKEIKSNYTSSDKKVRESMGKQDRLLNFYAALMHVTHLTAHSSKKTGNAEDTQFTRAEAIMLLGTTAAALSSFTTSLERHNSKK